MVAALSRWHQRHDAANHLLRDVTDLPAHVAVEAYSVLTRLPSGLAVPPAAAAEQIAIRFAGRRLQIPARRRASVLATLASAGVFGGATHDGLVALEAAAHHETLITLDGRAQRTYERLGVPFHAITA